MVGGHREDVKYDGGYKDGTHSPARWCGVLLLLRPRLIANLTGKYEGRGTERTTGGQYDGEFHKGMRHGYAEITPRSIRDHAETTPGSRCDCDVSVR